MPPLAPTPVVWFRIGCGLAAAAVLALLWSVVCTAPAVPWNAARLAPSFALAQGLPIYALRDSGAHLGWFYGPLLPLWYLPVTLAANPTLALMLASAWNALTLLAPVGLALGAGGRLRGWPLFCGLLLGAALLLGNSATRYGLVFVHVDTLCLAFGVLACITLHRAAARPKIGWEIPATALALALAVATKQIALVLGPALLTWTLAPARRRLFGPLLFWCVVIGALVAIAVFRFFGTEEVLFNTGLVFARVPWRGGARLLAENLGSLLVSAWAWLPAALWLGWRWRTEPERRAAGPFVSLLLLAAAWQLPLGLLTTLKVGGGLNSVHAVHYALLAGLVVTGGLLGPALRHWRPAVLWLLVLVVPLGSAFALARHSRSAWTPYRGQEELLALARREKGRIYLPWNPLITLLTERRVYPLDDALYSLWLSGLEPPAEKIRAAVPRDPLIIYEEPAQSHFALRYFPRRQLVENIRP